MMIVMWIIPFKSFKKSTKSQTKIKKFNMVNLFSITFRATTFLRDMITNNEQKDPMSTFCFWEKILFTFWWFYSTLERTGFYYFVNKWAYSYKSFLNFFSACPYNFKSRFRWFVGSNFNWKTNRRGKNFFFSSVSVFHYLFLWLCWYLVIFYDFRDYWNLFNCNSGLVENFFIFIFEIIFQI